MADEEEDPPFEEDTEDTGGGPDGGQGKRKRLFSKECKLMSGLQNDMMCNIGGNNTDYRMTPSDEDLGRHPQLNYSNSDVISIDCSVNLAANQEVSFLLYGNLWMRTLGVLKFKTLRCIFNAALQRGFRSAFVFREEDPSRQIAFEISKVEEPHIPIWIIIGSTLGGFLLLALLVLALWKLGFFQSATRKRDASQDQTAKDLD